MNIRGSRLMFEMSRGSEAVRQCPKQHALGGIIHTYQKYDPQNFPSPTQPPPDLVSGAIRAHAALRRTPRVDREELARAVRLDPSQIAGLGPSLEALMEMLRQRKRKILSDLRDRPRAGRGRTAVPRTGEPTIQPPGKLQDRFQRAVAEEQLYDLERLWYRAGDERSLFARQLVQLIARLGDKYQIDELAAKYDFTGRTPLTIPEALEIKEELEAIDRLLKQLEEAAKTAQIGIIDLEELAEFAEPGDIEQLRELARQIEEYLRQMAEQQGLEKTAARAIS